MGLRMFVEPEPESKVATKADPSAPARSAIRRQRTVRYTPHTRDHPSRALNDALSRELEQRRLHRRFMRMRNPTMSWTEYYERERNNGHGAEHARRAAEREASRADRERHAASQRQRAESGRALLRDALSYERPEASIGRHRDVDSEMFDPAPTSSSRASYSEAVQRPQGVDSDGLTPEERRIIGRARSPPPRYMPTPPYSFEEASSQSSPPRLTPPRGSAEYTSTFAPAARDNLGAHQSARNYARLSEQYQDGERDQPSSSRYAQTQVLLNNFEHARRETLSSLEEADRTIEAADRALSELPPLRRMPRRSHVPSPPETRPSNPSSRPAVDGLGDRSRSFSPEDDVWDTLLSTMTPDERIPSIQSSFTSASASASASSSLAPNASTNSYGTLVTPLSSDTSTTDLYPILCDNSDSEDSSSDSDPDRMIVGHSDRRIYSRRYNTADRAEQLVRQDAEERMLGEQEARFRMMRVRNRMLERNMEEREAQLARMQRDLDRLASSRQTRAQMVHPDERDVLVSTGELERRFGRERL